MPSGVVVGIMLIGRWLIGIPLALVQASREHLSKVEALAVFSADTLSSVAYATEEIGTVHRIAGFRSGSLRLHF
jgi:hypothetical protein